jgi:hypothetical protein
MTNRRYHTFKDYPVGRDEQGRPLCRFCKSVVHPPRRTICSDECNTELSIRTSPNYLRDKVLERDKGICAMCGCDTLKIRRILSGLLKGWYPTLDNSYNSAPDVWRWYAQHLGIGLHRAFSDDLWDADHIKEIADGGKHELSNMQTLCIACHKQKTARFMKSRAKRPMPQAQLFEC